MPHARTFLTLYCRTLPVRKVRVCNVLLAGHRPIKPGCATIDFVFLCVRHRQAGKKISGMRGISSLTGKHPVI